MGSIERYSKINKELLSGEFYFQALLQEAYRQAELSELEMESVQTQCIKLLADSTERYNKGQSSSVRVEVAQTIMASNFYTIGIYLKSLPDVSSAIEDLKKEPISELYRHGRSIINARLNAAMHLYRLVCRTKIQSPNYSYNATTEEGIKSFFKQYNPDYEAQETPASIDYQLMNPVSDSAGVEYIIKYLQSLYMENLFCSRFDPDVIHEVMSGYDETYGDLLVNIFGQVLQNALGCTILCKDILSLILEPPDIQELKGILKGETKESIYTLLLQKADELIRALGITVKALKTYIRAGLPELASRIRSAMDNDALQAIFAPRRDRVVNQVIRYSMGERMDDGAYRSVVSEVLACRYFNDKIQIIKEHIKTLSDMEDIITDGELSEAEALAVFDMLGDVEIAVLLKRHPYRRDIDAVDFRETEIRLRRYLEKYLQSIPEVRSKQLQRTAASIETAF